MSTLVLILPILTKLFIITHLLGGILFLGIIIYKQYNSVWKKIVFYFLMFVICLMVIVYILPTVWILVTSLKSPGDINTKIPKFFFIISFENYRKLLPTENMPIVGYLFVIQALCGLILFASFSIIKKLKKRVVLLRNTGLVWNILFIITCLYGFFTTQTISSRTQIDVRYHFFTLILCTVITYIIVVPRKKYQSFDTNPNIGFENKNKVRFAFVTPVILSIIGVCIILANGGSKYFYQFLNSIIIGGGSTVLAVGLGTFSAYAFSRFNIAGKDDLLFFILSTRMLPPVVVVIPIYLMYSALGLRDTHFGLILLYTTFNVSFAVWLMKGFIDEIPKEYEDAALVDGYTRFQTFMKVVLPQSVTGIAATAVFCLITAWNEFAFALVLTETGGRAVTAPPSITSATGSAGMDWGKIAASTFVFLLPVAIFTFLMRNHLLRGVTFGAVKK